MSDAIPCPFRHSVRRIEQDEWATCGLLQKLVSVPDANNRVCDVRREACEACYTTLPVPSQLVGSAFASILSGACEKESVDRSDKQDKTHRACTLGDIAEQAVLSSRGEAPLASCDVVIWFEGESELTVHSIESMLQQDHAETLVHFVLRQSKDSAKSRWTQEILSRFSRTKNVRVHYLPMAHSPLRAVHELIPGLSSEFVALQHCEAVAVGNRIHSAIGELRRLGGDLVGSPMLSSTGTTEIPDDPGSRFESSIPWPTLVFRRSSFIDLGGVAERYGDDDIELIYRARACGAKIISLPWPTVRIKSKWQPTVSQTTPSYTKRFGTLRHHALDFPQSTIACDVVVPVYGQIEYAHQAIESVIEQDHAEPIVHVIDDCGPDDVGDLFRFWKSHPRIRLYRNLRNLGQYTSFNNVSDSFETDFVAVQDGDDISLPHRLTMSGNLLALSDADFFAATMEQFGTSESLPDRRSRFPSRKQSAYFAMNPTACFRVSMFRSLGGYTDYGAHERNRCGLDTEFMNRAFYSQRRFAFSSAVVTRRRVHPDAATQRSDTGFGSELRTRALEESHYRASLMQSQRTDPRFFGALGKHRNQTKRVTD
ncbi:MAG: glycosyltransferase [Planctomycetota bacterium]